MSLLSNIQHVYATAASDIVKFGKLVETKILPALQKAEANAGTIEAITAVVSPQAANIERTAFAVLGTVIKAVEDSIDAGSAGRRGRNPRSSDPSQWPAGHPSRDRSVIQQNWHFRQDWPAVRYCACR